jgi:hypothetical protein
MMKWYQRRVEGWTRRVQLVLLTCFHPELARMGRARLRVWTAGHAARDLAGWGRYVNLLTLFVAGPISITITTRTLAHGFGWSYRMQSPVLVVLSWSMGFVITAVIIGLIRRKRMQSRCINVLRLVGCDICPECGYEMVGHAPVKKDRRCPECGSCAPTLDWKDLPDAVAPVPQSRAA